MSFLSYLNDSAAQTPQNLVESQDPRFVCPVILPSMEVEVSFDPNETIREVIDRACASVGATMPRDTYQVSTDIHASGFTYSASSSYKCSTPLGTLGQITVTIGKHNSASKD